MANGDKNGKGNALLTLAGSSDRLVQLGTLALVGASGLGSFFQGQQISEQVHADRDKAIREIHQLYNRVDEFEQRQLKVLSNQQEIIEMVRQNRHAASPEKTPE